MRYFLVFKRKGGYPDKVVLLHSKSALLDWISNHSFGLSLPIVNRIDLHRALIEVGVFSRPSFVPKMYKIGPRICSLREYIVKHKLLVK